jgi:two-component system chemotaxis sensor kinase CheA
MGVDLERLFRLEASELIEALGRGLLALEKDGSQLELIADCYRHAHTLKGAARAVRRTAVSDLAHTMEEALAPYRQTGEPVEPDCASDLLKLLELIRIELSAQPSAAPAAAPRTEESAETRPAPAGSDRFATVRTELSDLDALLSALTETRSQLRGLRSVRERLQRIQHTLSDLLLPDRDAAPGAPPAPRSSEEVQRQQRILGTLDEVREALLHVQHDVGERLGRAEQELSGAHELLSDMRLLRVSTLFPSLEMAVRDAAQLLGKQVELLCDDDNIRVEANVLSAVGDALLHMVRNAVDHGIEPQPVRQQRGKAPVGRIIVQAQRRGSLVAFSCTDDGGGIDVTAVREAALAANAVSPAEAAAMGADEAVRLIFRAGVSTSEQVTQVSGRGVGLDIVREVARRLGGEVSVSSTTGEGSRIGVTVPTSLSSLTALIVAVDGSEALLPLAAVSGAQRVSADRLLLQQGAYRILHEGAAIPFVPLAPLLGKSAADRKFWSVVIVQADGERLALGADRLEGTLDVIVKPLPPLAGALPLFAGAAFDAQGDPILLFDVRGLFAAYRSGPKDAISPSFAAWTAAPPARLPILVVDDSLTTRTLEQSVLEVAGYEVELASSGEEALTKARARRFGLFIVDIEMPGMSGIDFTEQTRADPVLQKVPVILVTSLASPEHRRRGLAAGASSYVVKSEFDQGLFLRRVAELLRTP